LAVKGVPIIADIERNRTTILALIVCKFVAVQFTDLLAIPKSLFSTDTAQKLISAHVLSHSHLVVVLPTVEDPFALVAVIKTHLFHHEFERVCLLFRARNRLTILLLVELVDDRHEIVTFDLPMVKLLNHENGHLCLI